MDRHYRNVFDSFGLIVAIHEGVSRGDFWNAWTASLSFLFTEVFTLSLSSVAVLVALGAEEVGSF